MRLIEDRLEQLPVPAEGKPVEKMSMSELLQDAAWHALRHMREILIQPLDPTDLKKVRLVMETANNATKLLARVEEAGLRATGNVDAVAALGNRLRALEKSSIKSSAAKANKVGGTGPM